MWIQIQIELTKLFMNNQLRSQTTTKQNDLLLNVSINNQLISRTTSEPTMFTNDQSTKAVTISTWTQLIVNY